MTRESTVESLEKALYERARRLGEEYLARGLQTRERMIEEENERMRLREERETLAAGAESERIYRRRVQAVELQLQGELDRHRWNAMVSVKEEMRERFSAMMCTDDYLAELGRLLAEGVAVLGDGDLVARLNTADRARLAEDWDGFLANAVPRVHVELDETVGDFLGGVLIRTKDDRVRMDNTFEGRLDRFDDDINQAIVETLFPGELLTETSIHG